MHPNVMQLVFAGLFLAAGVVTLFRSRRDRGFGQVRQIGVVCVAAAVVQVLFAFHFIGNVL